MRCDSFFVPCILILRCDRDALLVRVLVSILGEDLTNYWVLCNRCIAVVTGVGLGFKVGRG